MGTITNIDGEYSLEARRNGGTLVFSAVGYISKTVRVGSNNQTVNVKLAPDNVLLNEVVVKPQKEKYSRKNNPAVEFMKKVIEHKKAQVLEVNDYYQYDKYEKMKNVHQRPHTGKARKRYLQEIFILKRSGGSVGNNQ